MPWCSVNFFTLPSKSALEVEIKPYVMCDVDDTRTCDEDQHHNSDERQYFHLRWPVIFRRYKCCERGATPNFPQLFRNGSYRGSTYSLRSEFETTPHFSTSLVVGAGGGVPGSVPILGVGGGAEPRCVGAWLRCLCRYRTTGLRYLAPHRGSGYRNRGAWCLVAVPGYTASTRHQAVGASVPGSAPGTQPHSRAPGSAPRSWLRCTTRHPQPGTRHLAPVTWLRCTTGHQAPGTSRPAQEPIPGNTRNPPPAPNPDRTKPNPEPQPVGINT